MSSVTFKKTFVYDDYVESIEEVFSIDVSDDYERKVLDKEKSRLINITKPSRKVIIMDGEKVANLFYDYNLSSFQNDILKFMKLIEDKVLPVPKISGQYESEALESSKSNSDNLTTTNWTELERTELGPYAHEEVKNAGTKPKKIISKKAATVVEPAVDSKTKEATALIEATTEFQTKSNKNDPLKTIMTVPVDNKKRAHATLPQSPIVDDDYSVDDSPDFSSKKSKTVKAANPSTQTITASRNNRILTSPSRVGDKVQFDTQEDEAVTGKDAIKLMKEMQKSTAVKHDLPDTLSPAKGKKNITETKSNVFISRKVEEPISESNNRTKWSLEEEEVFADAIRTHGVGNWRSILSDDQYRMVSIYLFGYVIFCRFSYVLIVTQPYKC